MRGDLADSRLQHAGVASLSEREDHQNQSNAQAIHNYNCVRGARSQRAVPALMPTPLSL
jgi:vacuolar-type H+-ATPase subunit B/Vma2